MPKKKISSLVIFICVVSMAMLGMSFVFTQTFAATSVNYKPAPSPTPMAVLFRRGDADRNSKVDMNDIIAIGNSIPQKRPVAKTGNIALISPCYDATDANDDGKIDVNDMVFLINYLYGSKIKPPATGPLTPGIDPTSDSLSCQKYP